MNAIERFRDLFEYDRWSNLRVVTALRELHSEHRDLDLLLAHIVSAEDIWLLRLNGQAGVDPWIAMPLDESTGMLEELSDRWTGYLDGLTAAGITETITYRNSLGVEFNTLVEDVLTHVINHSTYHRGQIARGIKERGGAPPVTDFIAYVRDRR